MKLLYLTTKEFDNGIKDGVVKKIFYHIDAFKDMGYDVDYTYLMRNDNSVHFVEGNKDKVIGRFKCLPGVFGKKIIGHYIKKKVNELRYDAVYIRFLGGRTDPWFLDILDTLKKNPTRIALELPTYPYDEEASSFEIFIDRCFRNKLAKYVDRIVTYSQDDMIFNIPTIKTMNGVNVDSIKLINSDVCKTNELNLIAVASFEVGHGYERVINGLAEYVADKHERNVIVHMVGDGTERNHYEELVNKYGLSSNVIFYGKRMGQELDDIYDKADVGLGTFGWYKKNNYYLSSLKSREYLSKGLPVVTGVVEDVLQDQKYGLMFPNDPSPVDINKIIEWYDGLLSEYESKEYLVKEIHSVAKKTVDVSVVMKPVVDYFKEEKEK